MRIQVFVVLAVLLASCASGESPSSSPTERAVSFKCTTGEQLDVRFLLDKDAAILTRGGQRIELQQQPAASGFWYANGPNAIRGKGDELRVEIGRMAPLECRALSAG